MSLFGKRKESEIGSSFEWADQAGTYVAEVTDAYDSRVVYPDDAGKSRYVGVTVKLLSVIQDNGESDEDFADRKDQVGKFSRPRIYLTEKSAQTAFQLLTEICGSANMPADFKKKVVTDDTDPDNPEYDMKALAEHAPINPGQLVGRRFRAKLKRGQGKGLGLDPFNSWLVPESDQTAEPRDLFDGEDTASLKIKERIDRKSDGGRNGSSRSDGLNTQFDDEPETANQLPF